MTPWLTIIGIGEDGHLPPPARAALSTARLIVGGRRHLALTAGIGPGERRPWPQPITAGYQQILARRGEPVVVLASGDPFHFGVGTVLAGQLAAGEWQVLPAPSSLSWAAGRLGWGLETTAIVSLCGRPLASLRPQLQPGQRLLVLSADHSTPGRVAAYLDGLGFGPSTLHLFEALGGPAEQWRQTTAAGFDLTAINPLNLLGVEVIATPAARPLPVTAGLDDDLFETDGQLTKQEIRAVTLAALAPLAGELLWDIGGGSGSISIEWRLRHPLNRAIIIESHPERLERIRRNAESLGVPDLTVIAGRAPEALAGLTPPQAVFIGGGAHLPGVIDQAWAALTPGGRLVANGVTLETEQALIAARQRLGGRLTRLGVERLDRIGGLHGFRPAMTVTQWRAVKCGGR